MPCFGGVFYICNKVNVAEWSIKMRMSRVMLASAIGMMASSIGSALEHDPILGGEVSPFAFKSKPVGNKLNKVSQKKKRLYARRLSKF